MQLKLGLSRRMLQLKSALAHGGWERMIDVIRERQVQGYSTRALSYSWPKKVFLHTKLTREKSCHFLIPHLMPDAAFGGIATLAQLIVEFAQGFDRTYIYLTDFFGSKESLRRISRCPEELWKKIEAKIVLLDFSYSPFINLVANTQEDHFVASAWWTKLSLDGILGQIRPSQMTYIVQDEESLFYDPQDPVEDELKRAALTSYRGAYHVIVNSQFLADYLREQRLVTEAFSWRVLEPQINHDLFQNVASKREKILLVYARPEVRRNRFDLCLAVLKKAAEAGWLDGWRILGAGTLKRDYPLRPGLAMEALGKLSLLDYAKLAQRTAVALALMESPHPSYPPLELAACGARVVCNRFANKDYTVLGPQYYCGDLEISSLLGELKKALNA